MNKACFAFLFIFILVSSLQAVVSLPFYARWQSLNNMYYDATQNGKELSWDELYRAEIGVKELRYDRMCLDMELNTEHFFDQSHIKLKNIIFSAEINPRWTVKAGSREFGYGTAFGMDNLPPLIYGYDTYNFQMMRMNSLGIHHHCGSSSILSLDLGGNTHNQASGLFAYHYRKPSMNLVVSEEIRSMDNHWRTPVSISAISAQAKNTALEINSTCALSILPGWDSTKAHHELYLQAEAKHSIKEESSLHLGAAYTMREYAPYENSRYQIRLEHSITDKIDVLPICQLNVMDNEELWQYRLLGNYEVLPQSIIGLYYEYSYFSDTKGRHSIGLALSFGLDLSDAASGM